MQPGHDMQPGYYRDNDSWLYLTSARALYTVHEPDATEPVWREDGLPMSEDAEPKTPDAEDLASFEAARRAYGIPE
jgi:hypothetical protein